MSAYASVLCRRVNEISSAEMQTIFDVVEEVLATGGGDASNLIASGFLESLMAQASGSDIDFQKISTCFGPKARNYCQEWDRFTAVKTPGL